MRHLQATVVEHLAGVAAATAATPPPAAASVHTDTFLILAAVLCFLLCVVGLAFVARCSRMCNPSSYSVDADADADEAAAAAAMPAAPRKGVDKGALEQLPTVPFVEACQDGSDERPECAICLAEFARGDEVRVLPPCRHAFHAACVDTWLLSTSTCPSCRTAVVVALPQPQPQPQAPADPLLQRCASVAAQASAGPAELLAAVVVERGPCRTSVP